MKNSAEFYSKSRKELTHSLFFDARGREAVLMMFLQRDRIYSSEPFYDALERQARNNLQSELCRLQRG
jgi:predicted metal-dependent HD superfamily phosphohydrolase